MSIIFEGEIGIYQKGKDEEGKEIEILVEVYKTRELIGDSILNCRILPQQKAVALTKGKFLNLSLKIYQNMIFVT